MPLKVFVHVGFFVPVRIATHLTRSQAMRNTTSFSDQRNDVLDDGNHLARLRYQRIKALPLEPVPNDEFFWATAAQDKFFLGPAPAPAKPPPRVQPSAGLPSYLMHLYELPLLTREQEVHLFRKMNYLKFKASKLVALLDPERPDARLLDRIEQFYQQSVEVRNEIIRANLRLVVAMTKRYARSNQPLFELVSDGNISLMRAVEKFDYARGIRFSTYATCAIIRNFAQTVACEFRDRARFRNAGDVVFQRGAGLADQPADRRSGPEPAGSRNRPVAGRTRRPRAADHPLALWIELRLRTDDAQGLGQRDGHFQGTDPAIGEPGPLPSFARRRWSKGSTNPKTDPHLHPDSPAGRSGATANLRWPNSEPEASNVPRWTYHFLASRQSGVFARVKSTTSSPVPVLMS
jgi:hypothetical protein